MTDHTDPAAAHARAGERAPHAAMGIRRFGRVNWLGLWTLYRREVQRFLNVATQTIAAPVATSVLFMVVFSRAFAARRDGGGDVPFAQFLAPGVLMMTVMQNAFANTSSSMTIAKIQGNIVDTLMPPLSAGEILAGYVLGGMTRGILCALAIGIVVFPAVGLGVAHPGLAVVFALLGSMTLSLLGLLAGIWANKFDALAAIANFIITPLSFLSGTFYSIAALPFAFEVVSRANPFFYMIDGFRSGVLGAGDATPAIGVAVLVICNAGLGWLAHDWLSRGYRLKG
ncbi:MAG: ABC transporter permease [Pseudomonadota bacterium]